jgi:hypothetical protein
MDRGWSLLDRLADIRWSLSVVVYTEVGRDPSGPAWTHSSSGRTTEPTDEPDRVSCTPSSWERRMARCWSGTTRTRSGRVLAVGALQDWPHAGCDPRLPKLADSRTQREGPCHAADEMSAPVVLSGETPWSQSAPSGTRTPNPLIKSKPAINDMLTCGNAGNGGAGRDRLDAALPILY